jgi:tetratricopeptide (TPR) repeat protein
LDVPWRILRAAAQSRLEGRYDEATAELQEAVRLDPNQGDAWFALGRTLRARNDWPAAQEAYEKSIALKPDFAES